jgi:hypothetical protein
MNRNGLKSEAMRGRENIRRKTSSYRNKRETLGRKVKNFLGITTRKNTKQAWIPTRAGSLLTTYGNLWQPRSLIRRGRRRPATQGIHPSKQKMCLRNYLKWFLRLKH